jgi:aminocarboxymuconate-semialdehyde decarboxylase
VFSEGHVVDVGVPPDADIPEEAKRAWMKWREQLKRKTFEVPARLAEMDKMGVDMQVLTPSLVHQYTYWADPETSLKLERLTNDRIAEIVAQAPERFAGIGGVPLQAPELAIAEMRRCMSELGFRGVEVSSHAHTMELGDPRLRPFWAAAEELSAVIYLHPAGTLDPRYRRHQLWNSIGQPLEEAMAMSSLFYEGVLDAYPKLKLCIAHGGGYLPYYSGRMDRNYREKQFTRTHMTKSPSDYMKRHFWYDSCLYNVDVLEFLAQKVGASRIVMGSDYPVGEHDPVGFVKKARLSAADKEAILGRNAARLLGLSL